MNEDNLHYSNDNEHFVTEKNRNNPKSSNVSLTNILIKVHEFFLS